MKIRDELVNSGRVKPHHVLPQSGWVSFWFHNIEEEDVSTVIQLFRLRYEQLKPKVQVQNHATEIPKKISGNIYLTWHEKTKDQTNLTDLGSTTSNGPFWPNVMVCEWTHHISYQPSLSAVSLSQTKATVENIRRSKEFGVNLCASDQSVLASVAGGNNGAKYDKVNAFTFFL